MLRSRTAWLALAVLLGFVLLFLILPATIARIAGSQMRAAAAERGLLVSWRTLRIAYPARATFLDLSTRPLAGGDTLFRAESLDVRFSPLRALLGRVGPSRVGLAHATLLLRPHAGTDPDTLVPDEPRGRPRARSDPEGSRRLRRSAENLIRLLSSPASQLPNLTLTDVTVLSDSSADALWSGARIGWLDLSRVREGIRLSAVGSMLGEHEIPFVLSLVHGRDDRLTGGARIDLPDSRNGGSSAVVLSLDGTVHQDPRAGTVEIGKNSRVKIGDLALRLGARLSRHGPAVGLELSADQLDERKVKRSLPAPVLGSLLDVGVQGSWDYRLTFDLDLSRPDSVQFDADVIPHGLRLDPDRTRLNLLELDRPFVATIHLPRGRLVTRELSSANEHFRPLGAIAPHLMHAVVTNEDGGFFHHHGFNTEAVKGAIADNLRAAAFRRGAGTITMQLVRNLYLGHERTLSRKFQEVVLAWIVENLTGATKQRLLEIYLNIIEWGPDVQGADEAARFFFGRDAADLDLEQSLFLATIVPAPAKWRNRFDQDGNLRRFARAQMHFIGRAMVAKGWLSPDELPPTDEIYLQLGGRARELVVPAEPAPIDTTSILSLRGPSRWPGPQTGQAISKGTETAALRSL